MSNFIERPRTSCALGGALATLSALPRVVPIIHTALGCGGNLSGATAFGSGYCGSSYCSGPSAPSSGITETEIVFGGVDRLREEITSAFELIDADLFVVATGCMTEMIGDDVQGVVSDFAGEGKPILAISTPSFQGDAYAGYEITLEGIFNHYLPVIKEKNPKLVNLFGIIPSYDPFFRGDLGEIKRILERLGLSVNTFFTPDQTLENLKSAPAAALNIVFSQVWGTEFATHFQEKHGTPSWVTDLPIGPEATDRFLRQITERLGLDGRVTEQVVGEENRQYYGYFERAVDAFADAEYKFYAATVTNANYAIPVASYLARELGWIPNDVFVTDVLNDEQKGILSEAYRNTELAGRVQFETDTSRIGKALTKNHARPAGERYFDAYQPLYILGSTLEKELAAKQGASWLSISYPVYNRIIVDRGYAGYAGGLHLFEDLIDVLMAPK